MALVPNKDGNPIAIGVALVPNKDGDPLPIDNNRQSHEVSSATLCGYLDKLSGPLKVWRSLWFLYQEKECQLVYYRSAQDVNPLGWIELPNAILGDLPQMDQGAFYIQTPERTFTLKAVNSESMAYWLKQLQLKRWHHGSVSGQQGKPANHPTLRRYTTLSNVPLRQPPMGIHRENLNRSRSSQELSQGLNWEELCDPPLLFKDIIQRQPLSDKLSLKTYCDHSEPPSTPVEHQRPPSSERPLPTLLDKTTHPQQEEAEDISHLQQEVLSLAGEVRAQKDLVVLLQKALEVAQQEKLTNPVEPLRSEGHGQSSERWGAGQAECHAVHPYSQQVAPVPQHHYTPESQEHLRLRGERNQVEREMVVRLSQQVAALMSDPQKRLDRDWTVTETKEQLRQEIRKLKEDIKAYKTQNTFLNSEVYQLNKVWRQSSEQERNLIMKCAYLEAKVFRMESRFLAVLLNLQDNRSLERRINTIKTLVTEALRENGRDILDLNPAREYDDYGFPVNPHVQEEDVKLLTKLQALGIHSHDPLQQKHYHPQGRDQEERDDGPLTARWAQLFDGHHSGLGPALVASPKLKALLRRGVPRGYRQRVWRWVVWTRTRTLRERHPHHYQQLCLRSRAVAHPASRKIRLDLESTLRGNRHFSSPAKPAVQQLHRILLAFCWHNPSVGYCHALNRLAAMALLVLQKEEEAFWCLVAIVDTIMPQDFYNKSQIAAQVEQRVLRDYMAEKIPRLTAHLQAHGVDVPLVTSDWFSAVFVERLAPDLLLRVWDSFLYEGTKVIFRYALALFKYKEEDILKIHDCVDIYQYLRFFPTTITDYRKLMGIAFDMNPFPIRQLRQKRSLHLQRVQAELKELDRVQAEMKTERAQHRDRELGLITSEDEGEI